MVMIASYVVFSLACVMVLTLINCMLLLNQPSKGNVGFLSYYLMTFSGYSTFGRVKIHLSSTLVAW